MKTYLASLLRHACTALAGLGGFLAMNNLITPADAPAVDAAGVSLGGALTVVLTALAARAFITLMGKLNLGTSADNGTGSGMSPVWIGLIALAGFIGLALPACSPAQQAAFSSIPIKSCVITDYGTVCYSSKDGIEATVDATSGK